MVVPCEPFVQSQHGTLLVYDLTFLAFYFQSNGSRFSQLMLRLDFILFFLSRYFSLFLPYEFSFPMHIQLSQQHVIINGDDYGQAKRTLIMRHEAESKSNAYWLGLLAHLQASSVPRKVGCRTLNSGIRLFLYTFFFFFSSLFLLLDNIFQMPL